MVVEIQPCNSITRFRLPRLLLDAQCPAISGEFHNSVTLRIVHWISEDPRPLGLRCRFAQVLRQIVPVENVIPKHQSTRTSGNKLLPQNERLCDTFRLCLHSIFELNSELTSIAKQPLKLRNVFRSRDNQNFPDSRQHQRAQRVVDHWLVINGQQAFPNRLSHRIEPSPRTSRENDAFISCLLDHVRSICSVAAYAE